MAKRMVRVAIAGSPNCGKTTLFNALTGSRQHVGNYPGVTVERREGMFAYGDVECHVLDLPGSYSLSSFSPEERIAQQELVDGDLDVVVVVVDSTALQRGMVFLTQVLLNNPRVVLCLNMADEARKSGQRIDVPLLESLLDIGAVETVGHKGEGVDALRRRIVEAAAKPAHGGKVVLGDRLEAVLEKIIALFPPDVPPASRRWFAIKLLQKDAYFVEKISGWENREAVLAVVDAQRARIEELTGEDIDMFLSRRYFGFVDGLLREVVERPPSVDIRVLSDRIDNVVVHPLFGVPLFLGIMYGLFWLTFTVGQYPMDWLDAAFGWLGDQVAALLDHRAPPWVSSLVVDGIIGGVGGVLVFLPNILLLFFGLAILQDSGYMSRAAFLTDRVMHRFGLHGRSFIPLVTGFGCSIPGIMATRTVDNERDRLVTMLVLPLMSCGARLPIWMLLVPAFFPKPYHAGVMFGIYFFGIVLAMLLAKLLRVTILRGEDAPFVMELPPYRLPTWRSVYNRMMLSATAYLRKAGTIILAVSIVMWVLTTFPQAPEEQLAQIPPEQRSIAMVEYSAAGRIGKAIEPVIAPLGFDWKIGVAILGAFTAKEVFVSQLGVVYALQEADETSATLRESIARDYPPLVGVALMVFLLVAFPCMATLAITRKESGRWKWALLQGGGLSAMGYVLALVIYQAGSLLGLG